MRINSLTNLLRRKSIQAVKIWAEPDGPRIGGYEDLPAMKAATWQRRISPAFIGLALCCLVPAARAKTPTAAPAPAAILLDTGLPDGLPELPALGETMLRNLRTGLALNGFDPVAYQLEGRPQAGLAEHELIQGGNVWRFASAANLAAFRDAPATYAPAFAGFDPVGVANGVAVESDPGRFAVIGSRLFLFRSEENRLRFLQDRSLLGAAEARWSAVRRTVAR